MLYIILTRIQKFLFIFTYHARVYNFRQYNMLHFDFVFRKPVNQTCKESTLGAAFWLLFTCASSNNFQKGALWHIFSSKEYFSTYEKYSNNIIQILCAQLSIKPNLIAIKQAIHDFSYSKCKWSYKDWGNIFPTFFKRHYKQLLI